MCFYHSVSIKIEIDLSAVLALNQIANVSPEEDASKPPLCQSLHRKGNNQIVFEGKKY